MLTPLALAIGLQAASASALELGAPAPKLRVVTVGGEPVPAKLPTGRVHLVAFWNGTAAQTDIRRILDRHRQSDLAVIAVADARRRTLYGRPVPPRTHDTFDRTGDAAEAWLGPRRSHTVFVVDRDGRVAWTGRFTPRLEVALAAVLDGSFDIEFEREWRKHEAAVYRAWRTGDWQTMVRLVDDLIATRPSNGHLWTLKLTAYATVADDHERARKVARTAVGALAPHVPALARFVRFGLLNVRGLPRETLEFAADRLADAVERAPAVADAHLALIDLHDRLGDTQAAGAAAATALERLRQRPDDLERLAWELLVGRHPDAYARTAARAAELSAAASPDPIRLRLWFDAETRAGRIDAAIPVGRRLAGVYGDVAETLNDFAWDLLTEPPYRGRFDALALEVAEAMMKRPDANEFFMFDTLALAKFENGHIDAAITLQREALRRGGEGDPEYEERMRRYLAAKRKQGGG